MKTSTAVWAPLSGLGASFGMFIIMLIVGAIFPPLLVIAVIFLLGAPVLALMTYKVFCPNCCTLVIMSLTSQRCPTCRHRLVRRGTTVTDVT